MHTFSNITSSWSENQLVISLNEFTAITYSNIKIYYNYFSDITTLISNITNLFSNINIHL